MSWDRPRGARRVLRTVFGPGRDSGSGPAADRVLRAFGLVIGLVGTIAGLFELPEIIVQYRLVPWVWAVVTVLVAFGLLPVLAVVSLVAEARVIRPVAGAAALGYLTAMFLVLVHYAEIEAAPGPIWAHRLLVIGVLVAALAWSPLFVGGYLAVVAALPGHLPVFPARRHLAGPAVR
ncbi:hypothetical protein [Nocardia grenadensis]